MSHSRTEFSDRPPGRTDTLAARESPRTRGAAAPRPSVSRLLSSDALPARSCSAVDVAQMVGMAWLATGRALAMVSPKPGVGSAYTWTYRDANGDWLDPTRTYRLHLRGPIPAKDFWSVVVYDLWTRSMLANGQRFPSLNTPDYRRSRT